MAKQSQPDHQHNHATKKGNIMIKSVGYAYPSSANAEALNCAASGCYHVSVAVDALTPSSVHSGPYKTRLDAIKAADKLPYDWCRDQNGIRGIIKR